MEERKCTHLGDLLKAEVPIIKRHFSRHRWFQHLKDDEEAKIDFVQKYGFIMREMYCSHLCEDRLTCELSPAYEGKSLYEQLEFNYDT